MFKGVESFMPAILLPEFHHSCLPATAVGLKDTSTLFYFVTVISDSVEVLNMNILDFFLHGPTTSSGTGPPLYRIFTITLRHTALTR